MNKKEAKQNYKLNLRPAGVFQVRNMREEKVFVGSSLNLDGIFNRHEFQLKLNGHPNKRLQADWNELGKDCFAFEILEQIESRENLDYKTELEFLEDLWLEKLQPYGTRGYNEPKKTREERLQMIAENRLRKNY
ncbi:MAG: GIY-YIG nuclease family protein [Acidobacteriota bacterium]|nr:GIY-YIG nuclease family protein [Acidobacteriota bacterium]